MPGKLDSVQHLRAIAALGVVFYHALWNHSGEPSTLLRMGAAGVDLFFVISGFIMWYTAASRDEPARTFISKRILRIVPLYWLITTIVLAIVVLRPNLMKSASFDAAHTLASYAFVAWPHPKLDRFWPVVVPGWSLNYEMPFYLLVALSLYVERKWRALLVCSSLAGLVAIGLIAQPHSLPAFYTDPILLDFLYGTLIGVLYTSKIEIGRGAAIALLCAGIAFFALLGPMSTNESRALLWGIPMACVFAGCVNLPAFLPNRPFALLGDASYSIYLTQFCTIGPAVRLLKPLASEDLHIAVGAGIALLAVAIGVLTYYLVERPLIRIGRRHLSRQPHPATRSGMSHPAPD
jgi:exopolysaccharide production protein ExoZ